MKKGIFGSIFMALWLAASPALADVGNDSLKWLEGDYIGVGAIDMHKLAQRRIYTYLMNFFVTDKGVRQALEEIRASGVIMEETLQRIVVGVPSDVEHSEHIVLWETSEDLTKFQPLIASHTQKLNVRKHLDIEYYATKRENECLVILDNVLVLGSELRVKELIASYKAGYKKGPKSEGIKSELKRVNQKKDAWFVFSLTPKERDVLKRADPVIDMTQSKLGVLNMSEIQRGNFVLDFANGLNVQSTLVMANAESAERSSKILTVVVKDAANDVDIKDLGFASFMTGIQFKQQKSDLQLSVVYDQSKFDELISLVTQFAKSISGTSAPAPVKAPAAAPTPTDENAAATK